MIIDDAFDRYQNIQKGSLSSMYIKNSRYKYNKHIRPILGSLNIDSVTRELISTLFTSDWLQKSPYVKKDLSKILRSFFKFCCTEGIIDSNPCTHIRIRTPISNIRILETNEARLLQELCLNQPLIYPVYTILLNTGMRTSELLGLQWSDIDYVHSKIHISRAFSSGHAHVTKTRSSVRSIYVPSIVIDGIRWQANYTGKNKWIFDNGTGVPYTASHVAKKMKQFYISCGVPHVRLHSYRHYHATYLCSKGVSPKSIMSRLGWSHIGTFIQFYLRLPPDDSYVRNIIKDGCT